MYTTTAQSTQKWLLVVAFAAEVLTRARTHTLTPYAMLTADLFQPSKMKTTQNQNHSG